MNLEILICTNNNGIYNIENILLEPTKNISYLISHQIFNGKKYQFEIDRKDVVYKKNKTKGLSRNRNNVLLSASGNLCLIADDDVSYSKGYLSNIIKAFKENPDADIITFKIKTKLYDPVYKIYPDLEFWHNIRTIFDVSSIEIAFRLKSIKKANIIFDENFGLGSLFNCGEETIFLMDALKKGLKIKFFPCYIVNHAYNHSIIRNKYTNEKILTSGAIFYRIFGLWCIFFNLYSTFYNNRGYRSQKSFFQYLKLSLKGSFFAFKILKQQTENSFFNSLRLIIYFIKNKMSNYNKKTF